MDLQAAVEELYELSPDEFTSRRTALVTAARRGGDRSLSSAIGKLRRPALAAWLVNGLARVHTTELEQLSTLARQIRHAHRTLDGDRIRELSGERQLLLTSLTELARKDGGSDAKPIAETVLRQVRETLEAAIADEKAESAVLSGQLTSPLSYSGFGEVDLSDAVATTGSRPRLDVVRDCEPPPAPEHLDEDPTGEAIAEAEVAVTDSENRGADAARNCESARSRLEEAERSHAAASARVKALRDQLLRAEDVVRKSETAVESAQREQRNADQQLDNAQSQVMAARAELAKISQPAVRPPRCK